MSRGLAGYIEELRSLRLPAPRPDRSARVAAAGRSGVHKVSVRGHRLLSDTSPDRGGHDLGPDPVELLLAALGSSLVRSVLLAAAGSDVALDGIEVEVTHSGESGISYRLAITAPGIPDATVAALHDEARARSEVLAALTAGDPVAGIVEVRGPQRS